MLFLSRYAKSRMSRTAAGTLSLALRLAVARGWTSITTTTVGIPCNGSATTAWLCPSDACFFGAARARRGKMNASMGGPSHNPLRWRLSSSFRRGQGGHVGGSSVGTLSRAFATAPGASRGGSLPVAAAAASATSATAVGDGSNGGASSGGGKSSHGSPGAKLLRLTRLLADRAVGTRSEVEAMVRQGRVKVDGSVVKSPKTKLPVDSLIEVNGKVCGPPPLLVAFHKPKGVITTMKDDWDREDLSDVLPKSLLLRHHPVGRLDGDSSGLLLFSSDGILTHRLLSPRYTVEREYVATVDVPPTAEEPGEALVAALKEGVATADGVYSADVPGINGREVRVVVREGKNRMVRRMLANAGYPVLELRRERYGNILLGDLAAGEHEPVSGGALDWARGKLEAAGVEYGEGDAGEQADSSPSNL